MSVCSVDWLGSQLFSYQTRNNATFWPCRKSNVDGKIEVKGDKISMTHSNGLDILFQAIFCAINYNVVVRILLTLSPM